MRAIVQNGYGGPEQLEIVEQPTPAAGLGEILIRTHAVDVSVGDGHLLRGRPSLVRLAFGLRRPKVPVRGMSSSGVVVAVGDGVTTFQVGDEVVAEHDAGGALAEYRAIEASRAVRKPARLEHTAAATLPWAEVALQSLRDHARIPTGGRVLIHGAAGGVGHLAVQLGASFGADVTGTARGAKVDWVRELGARRVIDTGAEDLLATKERYDAILDMVGDHPPSAMRRLLTERGAYVAVGGPADHTATVLGRFARIAAAGAFRKQRSVVMLTKPCSADLRFVALAAERGALVPEVGAIYPFERTADAFANVLAGGTRGKTVVAFDIEA